MVGDERVKLLCSFGGEFVREQGRPSYLGGKTRLVTIDRSSSFRSLLAKMAEVCDADPSSIDIKFQLPDGSLDSRLISVETDDDVRNMIEEFDPSRKVPIFLFTDRARISDEDEDVDDDDDLEEIANEVHDDDNDGEGLRVLDSIAMNCTRETAMFGAEETYGSSSGPSTSATSFIRDYERSQVARPSVSGEMFRRDCQSLVVGQEYDGVQTFRNALTSAAIAANFELHMIRSDQRRVTARCAAEGCTWRVHASKLPQVNTFRVRTLTAEHTCERSGDGGHRQATAKWIANCIREKLRQNRNYKPREILNDIRREYGVLITYKRAFLGREKALEELRTEPKRDMGPIEHNYESMSENSTEAWGEIHDPPRRKRVCRPSDPKEVRPVHCTQCNQIGHNRRTCTFLEPLEDGSG